MEYVGQPYSGSFDFVETRMNWPITHMVAPADQALNCQACHSRESRLANVTGIYLPGSGNSWGGRSGAIMLALVLLGVALHSTLRLFGRRGSGHG